MRRALASIVAVALVAGSLMVVGCGQKATSSTEAIQHAQALKTPQEQADYLISQAKAFLNLKNYQEATATAQYILAKVDQNSQAAQDLLQQATQQAANAARAAVKDAKKRLGL